MKKYVVLCLFVFLLAVSTNTYAGNIGTDDIIANAVTSDKILDGTITTNDIADGSVTGAKIFDGSVSTNDLANNIIVSEKILDGTVLENDLADESVSDAKIKGQISANKISSLGLNSDTLDGLDSSEFASISHGHFASDVYGLDDVLILKSDIDHNHDSNYEKKYSNVITVSKDGGDFSSIQEALQSIPQFSSEGTLVRVMPGTYNEDIDAIYLSNVELIGSGGNSTIIDGSGSYMARFRSCTNIGISGFLFDINDSSQTAIFVQGDTTKFKIQDNRFRGTDDSGAIGYGLAISFSARGRLFVIANEFEYVHGGLNIANDNFSDVSRNHFINDVSYFNDCWGINSQHGDINITNNYFEGLGSYSVEITSKGRATVSDNTMINTSKGVLISPYSGTPKDISILNNKIVDQSWGILMSGYNWPLSAIVSENTIENCTFGINSQYSDSSLFSNNIIRNSASVDIRSTDGSTPVFNFNTFDTYSGAFAGFGNANSSGQPVNFQ